MKFSFSYGNQFQRDYKLAKKRGKDFQKLEAILELLGEGEALPAKFRDHELRGEYRGFRECHVEPDWLLIYHKENLVIALTRMGSHSDLFG